MPRRLILRSFQSPGDIVMLTAAIRDLHRAQPGQFLTDVRTSCDALWENNPYLTRLSEGDPGVEVHEMHYPLIHQSNQRPYHFLHGFPQYLEQILGISVPLTEFRGDVHLSAEERRLPPPGADLGVPEHFWIVLAGGKYDFTAKWWNPAHYQAVVDHFRGKITFVQCGEAGHWHPPLQGVINLVGRTSPREFVRLMHHAEGVLCPVTWAMHLAAAVETRPGGPVQRACVVVAGGREPPHWEAYPQHQFLSNVGALPCCAQGGCWKSRCQPVGDGDPKDHHDLCVEPVQITPQLRIPKCLDLITPAQVIDRIDLYYRGGVLRYTSRAGAEASPATAPIADPPARNPAPSVTEPNSTTPILTPAAVVPPRSPTFVTTGRGCCGQSPAGDRLKNLPGNARVLFRFRHGLGDAVQFTCVLQHLQRYFPGWTVDLFSLRGKHSAFTGLCRRSYHDQEPEPESGNYEVVFDVGWHEAQQVYPGVPSTKVSRFLHDEFGIQPDPDLYQYQIHISDAARQAAARYLAGVVESAGIDVAAGAPTSTGEGGEGRFPVLLVHYQGNTSQGFKDLSHATALAICRGAQRGGLVPVILDWDRRSPLPDQALIFCPTTDDPLWRNTGTGDAELLAALVQQSAGLVGIDSGPLHVAGATRTPTIGVWTRHFTGRYFDLADNVLHLIPEPWRELPLAETAAAAEFFLQRYRYQLYRDLDPALVGAVQELARAYWNGRTPQSPDPTLIRRRRFWVRQDNAQQDFVIVQDIYEQDAYRTRLLPTRGGPAEVVFDIGAHIGTFARLWHERNPEARIVCVEACPENLVALRANVGEFAEVVHAACTYAPGRVVLRNAVRPDCESTGGSIVVQEADLEESRLCAEAAKYWDDRRELPTVTLEDLLQRFQLDHIDVLKLDCEGSEFSILGETPSLSRIGAVIGEYHGREAFERLVAERLADWTVRSYDQGELGNFCLLNPSRVPPPVTEELGVIATPAAAACPPTPEALTKPVNGSVGDHFCERLAAAFHETDRPQLPVWLPYYRRLYELARELRPLRFCEIGVRAGYSAFTFLAASPEATGWGLEADRDETLENTHGGRRGLWRHAVQILPQERYEIVLADSQTVDRLAAADLVYVDGDHTFEGCLHDLRLAAQASDRILVDDFDSIPTVRQACDTFTSEHPEFQRRYLDNGLTGFLLLERHRDEELS